MKITKSVQSTAYHEAGHAVIAWNEGIKINTISIISDNESSSGRINHSNPLRGIKLDCDSSDKARLRVERAVRICLAGPISQRKFNPRGFRKYHAESDWRSATDLLLYFTPGSHRNNNGEYPYDGEYFNAYWKILEIQTRNLLNTPYIWNAVVSLAEALFEEPEIKRKEIRSIIKKAMKTFQPINLVYKMGVIYVKQ